jgi:TetR/AcrR family transcriptional regulator, regulator of autoinduction and epiphytic fitness
VTTLDPPNPPATDGRRARAERTRAAIISAFIQLISEGEGKPTGAQIAGKAGTSIRALWANFADLESLYEATGRVLLARQDERTVDIPVELPLPERIDRFCAQRAGLLEDIAPFARASRVREPFSVALRHNRRRFLDRAAANVEQVFAPELAEAGRDRDDLVLAITASTSWSWWSVLRDDFELDVPRCTEIMSDTLSRVLTRSAAA